MSPNPTTVAFDDQIVTQQVRGGISRYVVQLLLTLPRLDDPVNAVPLWSFVKNEQAAGLNLGRIPPVSKMRVLRPLNTPVAQWRVRHERPDVIHHTYTDASYLGRFPSGIKRAVTIYDMTPELFPELFPDGNPHLSKEEMVQKADLIFCISESTRADMARLYGKPNAPVFVTPLSADPIFRPSNTQLEGTPSDYLLFVGNRRGYKDFALLLEVFADLAREHPQLHLITVGGGGFSDDEQTKLSSLSLDNRVTNRAATDSELASLYSHALIFVFPSRYEGFGIPTLEAMGCGCPTVLARSSSHIEIGGSTAAFFEAANSQSLFECLSAILGDQSRRAQMSAAGLAWSKSFTWDRCASLTADGYRSATVKP